MNSYENPELSYECDLTAERDRLMAINKELLAALEQIATADHPDYPYFQSGTEAAFGDHLIDVARAAIAKASQ